MQIIIFSAQDIMYILCNRPHFMEMLALDEISCAILLQ